MSQQPDLVLKRKDGSEVVVGAKQAHAPDTASRPEPHVAGPQVEHDPHSKIEVVVSKEVEQQRIEKKKAHTYTIEQLRRARHDRELANGAVFQFHAEIQLYKRYLAGTRRKETALSSSWTCQRCSTESTRSSCS